MAGSSAVSCSGLLACTAVGGCQTQRHPLAERWDGTAGTFSPPRTPRFPSPAGSPDVSCPAEADLHRRRSSNGPTNASPLVERWFGRVNSWGLQTAPEPDGVDSAGFTGVSCPDGPGVLRRRRLLGQPAAGFQGDIRPLPSVASARPGRSCPPRTRGRRRAVGLTFDAQLLRRQLSGTCGRVTPSAMGWTRPVTSSDRRALRRSELAARNDPLRQRLDPAPRRRLLSEPALLHGRRPPISSPGIQGTTLAAKWTP